MSVLAQDTAKKLDSFLESNNETVNFFTGIVEVQTRPCRT
jgi:hypothetical protein